VVTAAGEKASMVKMERMGFADSRRVKRVSLGVVAVFGKPKCKVGDLEKDRDPEEEADVDIVLGRGVEER
jgi:hypothetical protein